MTLEAFILVNNTEQAIENNYDLILIDDTLFINGFEIDFFDLLADLVNSDKHTKVIFTSQYNYICERLLNRNVCFKYCVLESKPFTFIEFLRYYKSKTQTETANMLGMTQVQVSRRERVILSKMRQLLA